MKTNSEVLALTVEDLGLSAGTTRWIRNLVLEQYPQQNADEPIFVSEVIAAYEKRESGDRYSFSRRKIPSETRLIKKLTELGLTRFDFLYLSPETVTQKEQKARTKEEWLKMPVLLLGTMKPNTIEYFARYRESVTDIQVHHLLGENHRIRTGHVKKFKKSFAATRALLKKLGFTTKDGGIMLIGTLEGQAQELALKYSLPMRTARTVVRIAKQEGWRYVAD